MGSVWSKLEENETWAALPRWAKFGVVNVAAHVLAFWGPNALLHICYNNNLFQRYKIQNALPPAELVTHAFWENIKSDLLAFPVLAWPLYKLLTMGFRKEDVGDSDKEGWSSLYFGKTLPSGFTMAWQVFVAYLCYDCMFYFSHRALHSKARYVKYHKQHHQFTSSIGLASSHQHAVEGAIQLLNWYIPVGIAGWMNGGIHISTVFAYNVFRWIETVDAHCGKTIFCFRTMIFELGSFPL
jgi:sterol desaturase/sphingolipid hydroxylase (fatty acid hydroxylase superfamily)